MVALGFLAALPAIGSALGSLFGGAGKGEAAERGGQNKLIADQNQTRAHLYGTQQGNLTNLLNLAERGILDRAQLGITAPQARTRQAALGSLLANMQPARLTPSNPRIRVPQMSGGLSPAALSPAARASGGELQRQAILALLSGSDIPKMPNFSGGMLPPPQLGQYKQPGKFESFLSGAGLAGGALGALGPLLGRKSPPSFQDESGGGW